MVAPRGGVWLLGGAWLLEGACMVAPRGGVHGCSGGGGHVWLLQGGGEHAWLLLGRHVWLLLGGCAWLLWGRGACMVAPGGWGCVWLLLGGCMVATGVHVWLLWGTCVVARGHAWLLPGGMHDCSGGGHAWDTTRYGDTVNERAVRILLKCIPVNSSNLMNSSNAKVAGRGGGGARGHCLPPDPVKISHKKDGHIINFISPPPVAGGTTVQ